MQFQRILELILGDPKSGRESDTTWSAKAVIVTAIIVLGALLVILFVLRR